MESGPLFWQQIIQPNTKEQIVFNMDSTLGVTSASLLKVEDSNDSEICRLWAFVHEPNEEIPDSDEEQENNNNKEEEKTEENKEQHKEPEEKVHKFLFASLQPNLRETSELNYFFSPFDIVELENTSKYPIQLTGTFSTIEMDEEEEEEANEEEENKGEEESLNVNELQKKVIDFMKEKGHQ